MFRLVESIRIENKQLHHIDLHNKRFNEARRKLFGIYQNIDLSEHIQIPESISDMRYKCRVTTLDGIQIDVEITPYEQRIVKCLKLVEMDDIDYSVKTDQRQLLNKAYDQRGNCDDIIIVKNKCLTDSWAANIILYDGVMWVTPDTPLLNGVQREFLIQNKKIERRRITVDDLVNYKKIRLINALVDFDRAPEISIDQIMP